MSAENTTETPLPVSTQTSGREPTAAELSAMGIHTDPVQVTQPDKAQAQVQPNTQPATEVPDDFVGKLVKPGRPGRDFEGLDEEEISLFKSMSRQAYEKLYPLYKSTKGKDLSKLSELDKLQAELESAKKANRPTAAYDHEEGYLLDRSYRQALVEQRTLNDVVSFYTKQLAAVRGGQKYHRLTQDDKGNIVVDPNPIDPSPMADAELTAALSQTQNALLQHGQKLEGIKSSFNGEYKTFRDNLTKVHDSLFGQYKDILEPLAAKELKAHFPEFLHDRPEIKSLATALAVLRYIANQNQTEQQQAAAANANATVARSAGPTARAITPAAAAGTPTKTSDQEFNQIRFKFGF